MTSTLADVAKAAGVHPGTASKALNPETRHRVADDTGLPILGAVSRTGQAAAVSRQRVSLLRFAAASAALLVAYLCILILQAGGFLKTGLVG